VIFQQKAIEKICLIKGVDPQKAQLSFICDDLSDLSKYTKSITTPLYRILKSHIPGPFTFILPASKEVPKILKSKKNTIGLRVPDHAIVDRIQNWSSYFGFFTTRRWLRIYRSGTDIQRIWEQG
jgi:tRNA A37 threonylcarbamoyladenosine synthetase subunit TsaC/SUA5/YrdC